jgi:hypothetical protein
MLIVNNGSFKSGSSWLGAMIRRLDHFAPPPAAFLNERWQNPNVPKGRLKKFMQDCDLAATNYYIKSHYADKRSRDLILAHSDTRVVLITRDVRDVVVSAYYHHRRVMGYNKDFDDYFRAIGRLVVASVIRYNRLWNIDSPKVFHTTYETLKAQPVAELTRLVKFLQLDLGLDRIEQIVADTRFEAMKARDPSGHVREGKSGGYGSYLNAEMLAEIDAIEARGNLRWIDRIPLKVGYLIRRALKRVTAGTNRQKPPQPT